MSNQDVSSLPGALPLRTENIGPLLGERTIGYVPYGLSGLRAPNENGKSRVFSALLAMQLAELKPGQVSITDGTRHASIGLGPSALTVMEVVKKGKERVEVGRQDVYGAGPILELPDPVVTLVDADHVQDEDAARRRRVQGLARIAQVQVTEESIRRIIGTPIAGHEDLADQIVEQHARRPYATLVDAIEAYSGPRGELNKRALAAEKAAEAEEATLERLRGAVDGALSTAVSTLGVDEDQVAGLQQQLAAIAPAPFVDINAMRRTLSAVEASDAAADREEERRRKVIESHGARPPLPDRTALATAQATIVTLDERRVALLAEIARVEAELRSAREAEARASRDVDAARRAIDQWEQVEAALSQPIERPEPGLAEKLRARIAEAEREQKVATLAGNYQRHVADVDFQEKAVAAIVTVAKALRDAKAGAWDRLADEVNSSLPPGIIRIGRTGDVEMSRDDGQWFAVTDVERISKGRLRRACLDLFVATSRPDVTVLISEEIMLPIDERGRRMISEAAAARKIRLLFELPTENGSVDLVFYGAQS